MQHLARIGKHVIRDSNPICVCCRIMNREDFSERDICTKFVMPALVAAGWDLQSQIREEVTFTAGRVIVRGSQVTRGEARRADFVLYYKLGMPLSVIEAKDKSHSVGAGMQQALAGAEALDAPFAFSTNGDAFLEHDRTRRDGVVEREIPLSAYPSPAKLWQRYCAAKNLKPAEQAIITQDYHADASGKAPRYYQQIAIIPLPPLVEQRRIVAKVDQLMALVDQLEAQLAASRAMAPDLLDALVSELTTQE